jgi:hypothetical protein
MLYQLPNGKCIEISLEQYLSMSDDELNMYMAYNIGEEVNDPFALSVLRHGSSSERPDLDDFDLLEESSIEDELGIKELTDIPSEEKLDDIDYTGPDDI